MRTVQVVSFALLLSFSMLDGVKSDCNYFQDVEIGKTYYAYNSEYPNNYTGENHCTWKTSSPYIVRVNCSINIPASNNSCNQDVLSVQFAGRDIQKYCGYGTLVLEGINATIKLDSSSSTEGGKFLCEIRAEEPIDKNNCSCGWKNPTRIVGGKETGVNEFPMMAGLVDSKTKQLYCGATIISRIHVITAAHCVSGRDINTLGVIVGEHDVNTGNETDATRLYRINTCIVHPGYNGNDNDIAVCKINGTIKYSNKVGPVCLPFQHFCDSFGGDLVSMLGWGLLGFGDKKSNTLQEVEVNVITNKKCSEYYNVTRNQLCTYTPGKDSCQMDSGGPVLWENPSTHNIVLVGIISSGIGCASKKPAVSMRVGAYLKWIESVTPGVQYCEVE